MSQVSDAKWNELTGKRDFGVMLWFGIVGFFIPFMLAVPVIMIAMDFGILGFFIGIGILLIPVFISIIGAAHQLGLKHQAELVLGLVSNISKPMSILRAAQILGMRPVTFTRILSELNMHGVVELEIYPEVGAFGPLGQQPQDPPNEGYSLSEIQLYSGSPWTRVLRWIGIIGTIVSTFLAAYNLLQLLLPFG